MRLAASAWEKDFSERLSEAGFKKGKLSTAVFHREQTGCRLVVHSDDLTFLYWEDEVPRVLTDMR